MLRRCDRAAFTSGVLTRRTRTSPKMLCSIHSMSTVITVVTCTAASASSIVAATALRAPPAICVLNRSPPWNRKRGGSFPGRLRSNMFTVADRSSLLIWSGDSANVNRRPDQASKPTRMRSLFEEISSRCCPPYPESPTGGGRPSSELRSLVALTTSSTPFRGKRTRHASLRYRISPVEYAHHTMLAK